MSNFNEILRYFNNKATRIDYNILWIPENKFFDEDLENLKLLTHSFNIYILNWLINIDKVLNKIASSNYDEDDHVQNCFIEASKNLPYFCDSYLNINELGRYLILKLSNKSNIIPKGVSTENYIIDNSKLILKINNYSPSIMSDVNKRRLKADITSNNFKSERISYRIALLHAEPFVMTSENSFTNTKKLHCKDGVPCLELKIHENFYQILNITDKKDFFKKFNQMFNRENLKLNNQTPSNH